MPIFLYSLASCSSHGGAKYHDAALLASSSTLESRRLTGELVMLAVLIIGQIFVPLLPYSPPRHPLLKLLSESGGSIELLAEAFVSRLIGPLRTSLTSSGVNSM